MVNDTSLEEDAKNDLNMDDNNTIGALQNMNFISKAASLDGYDLIDFSLLDDGYSEIPEENTYAIENQQLEQAAQESIYESTVPFEEMKKSDLFLHDEIVQTLFNSVYGKRRLVHEIADGFYDLEAEHNGLVRLWNLQESRRKNVVVRSEKPLVDGLLGSNNNNDAVENALISHRFMPILSESKRTFEKYAGDLDVPRHESTDGTFPPFATTENYGTLRSQIREGEDSAYKNNGMGLNVSFSDNRSFSSMLFDADVFLFNTYEAVTHSKDFKAHRVSNSIQRNIAKPSSSRDNIIIEKDIILEKENKNVVGFVEKNKNKNKKLQVYNLKLQELDNVTIDRNQNNAYLFPGVENVQQYAKLLEFIIPSMKEILEKNNIKSIEKFNKKIKKYDYALNLMKPDVFDNLKNKLENAANKQYKNKFSKLKYTPFSPNFLSNYNETTLFNDERLEFLETYYGNYKKENKVNDNSLMRLAWYNSRNDNGNLLLHINSDKIRREIVSLNARQDQKKYSIYSKYFIFQKQSIRDKIMSSCNDEVEQKELFKQYITSHGIISKMSHSIVDGQGNYICCSHTHDLLMENIDQEGLLISYGLHYAGGYMCKYCGEHLHTDYDEGASFDEDGNIIVSHGQIELEETVTETEIVMDEFSSILLPAIVDAASLKYKDLKINKNDLLKMFLKNMKMHTKIKSELDNVFSIDTVKSELLVEKSKIVRALETKVGKGKLNTEKIRIEVNTTYITSMVCYKVAVFASVFMLQLQLKNPQLFGENEAYIKSFVSIVKQQIVLDAVASYIKDNVIERYQGSYNDLIMKKKVVPIGMFNSVPRSTANLNILESVLEDNYKNLLNSEKVDIILAKHSLKNSNVVTMQRNVVHYGSIREPQTNMASDFVKLIDSSYKELNSIDDYAVSLRLTVDISSTIEGNKPRKEFSLDKKVIRGEMVALAKDIDTKKKQLDASSKKNSFVKNIRNDVVSTIVNPSLGQKGTLKPRILARKLAVRPSMEENVECSGSKNAMNNIDTIVTFIMQHIPMENEDVKELEFVKYWMMNSVFNANRFTTLYSSDLLNMSSKKFSELKKDIVFSDSMKIRQYSDYYLQEKYREIDSTFKDMLFYFLQNYLRQSIKLYSKEEISEKEEGFVLNDPSFKSYETLEPERGESTLCVMLREMVHNIELVSNKAKYSLCLLKVSYDILLNISTKNATNASAEALHYESKRKEYINMKNAKERKSEVEVKVTVLKAMVPPVVGPVQEEAFVYEVTEEGLVPPLAGPVEQEEDFVQVLQETSDDIPVDIIEESEGNYASV